MRRKVFLQCPECGKRFEVFVGADDDNWINADCCPKCGTYIMRV